MDDSKYLIFELVCDYLKGRKTCENFRLVSSEFKIISSNLFRRHYSAYLLNKLLIDKMGFDYTFTLEDLHDYGYPDVLYDISSECYYDYKVIPLYVNSLSLIYKDIYNPINNIIGRVRFEVRKRISRKTSILFNMALDYASPPRLTEFLKEKYIL